MLLDVLIAVILGGLIGLEREWRSKPAGLRTNMIISGASALFVGLGRHIMLDYAGILNIEAMGMDPIRLLHAVIVGVGFIGAGTIIKSSDDSKVMYLTTAATIWMSAAVGLSVGLKQYVLGCGVALMMIVINYLFWYLGKFINRKSNHD